MTPAAGRGKVGCTCTPPGPPASPRVIRVGGAAPHQASPSLSEPISTPSEAPLKTFSRGGGAHRLQPTASSSPRCGCHRRAVCPPARAQTSSRLAGRTGGPRLARPHPRLRNKAAQGRAKVSVWIEAKWRDVSPAPHTLLPAPCSLLTCMGACRAELCSTNPSQPQPRPQSQAYAEP